MRWEICWQCGGEGKHSGSIDSNGVPDEYWGEPDFAEDYFSGAYDQRCRECDGTGKVRTLESLTDEERESIEVNAQIDAQYRNESIAYRMGL